MFYIYEYYIVETKEIIYVGKGCNNRYKAKKKNNFLNRLLKDNNCDCRIVAYYETEQEAFEAERRRINELKAIGQAVCNKIVYSSGGVQSIWTEERRKQMSINNPMKDKKQRERMSINNPMKNKEIAMKSNAKKRIKVELNGTIYDSVAEAASKNNVCCATIKDWSKKGKCKYIYNDKKEEKIVVQHIENRHLILCNGKTYSSTKEAAKAVGVGESTISRCLRLKRGFLGNGISCKYLDDETEYLYHKPNKAHANTPIILNGKYYSSLKEASEDTNISCYILSRAARKIKTYKNIQCEYVNQQPSHKNSDKGIVEGSTTNE